MRLTAALVLLATAAPARAQWEPLPPAVVSPAQVPLFGFAEAFGDRIFDSTARSRPSRTRSRST